MRPAEHRQRTPRRTPKENNMPEKNKYRTNRKRSSRRSLWKYAGWFILAMGVFLVLFTTTVIGSSPKIDTGSIYSYLSESSTLYDDQGKLIDNVYMDDGNRINIDYDQMPQNLVNAVVSIEDKTFWKHNGFNVTRIFGAIKDSIVNRSSISGTSTITQQLARNVYLAKTKSVRSLNRKVAEAWYTVLLEKNLSKKQIMEAYLNTIYLGNNSYGVQAASKAYFSKDAGDLDLVECAALAAIPKSPDSYALVRNIDNSTIESEAIKLKQKNILDKGDSYTLVYNGDTSDSRRQLVLALMKKQGYITASQYRSASRADLLGHMDVNSDKLDSYTSYFRDYVISQVIDDLHAEGYSEAAARRMVYTGGLKIHTSLNTQAQSAVESAFKDSSNFPSVDYGDTSFDAHGNILSSDGDLLLYNYNNYFSSSGSFRLKKREYYTDNAGDLVLRKNKRLTFTKTGSGGSINYTIGFKNMYSTINGIFYTIEGGTLLVPQKYKSMDSDGNLIISKSFFSDYPEFFTKSGSSYRVSDTGYSLKQKVRQPQAAMVICDYKTGEIKAMVGGRGTTGDLLYNRATSTRQPGSSIKPLSVYSSALQEGANAAAEGNPMQWTEYDANQNSSGYGNYWTAASMINDAPLTINGRIWPKNAYNTYKGEMSMRTAVEQSCNVAAVRVFQQLGPNYPAAQLEKFGITSVVTNGSTNDMNAAALALGGMSKGISPLQMASAYGTFPNEGKHMEHTSYSYVKDRDGSEILSNDKNSTRVIDKGVAFIMGDILHTTVTEGIATSANTGNQYTAGKTGTTSDNYDAWFCGYTPQYSAALWIGNDVNLELTEGSPAAARLWGKIMAAATRGMTGTVPSMPSSVVQINGEYYINGTQSANSIYNNNNNYNNDSNTDNTDKKNNAADDNNQKQRENEQPDTNNNNGEDQTQPYRQRRDR